MATTPTSGNDFLVGTSGNDVIDALAGNDVIVLGEGSDILVAGAGKDVIRYDGTATVTMGGAINDTDSDILVVSETAALAGNAAVKITDFVTGALGDKLDIGRVIALLNDIDPTVGLDPFASGRMKLIDVANGSGSDTHLVVDFDGAGTQFGWTDLVTLQGVLAKDVTPENFVPPLTPHLNERPTLELSTVVPTDPPTEVSTTPDAPNLNFDFVEGDGVVTLHADGTIAFDDNDLFDLVTISSSYKGDIGWSDGTLSSALVDDLTLTAFTASEIDADAPGGAPWNYTSNPVSLDFLGEGETINYSFEVIATDNSGALNDTSDPRTVTITITGTNDAPEIAPEVGAPTLVDTASSDTFASITGQLDATDPDHGATLSYGLASSEDGVGAYGSLTVNPDGTYTFVADAAAINGLQGGSVTDVFSVTVDDGLGGTASTTLTININGTNDTPEITAEVGTPTLVDTAANDTFANVTGQLDATDRDSGATLSYGLASSEDGVGAYGSLTVNPDGTYTFVADAAAINGLQGGSVTDVFSVTVDDGLGGTASTTLTININGANDTPEITAEVGTPTLVDTAANDTFANVTGQLDATDRDSGPTLSYGLASSEDGVGAYGSLTVNPDGTYTFVPDAVAINALPVGPVTDVFSVTVDDGLGGTASTTLTININGANDTPEITAEVGTPTLVDTAANDTFANVTGQLDATDRDSGATLSYGLASSEDGVGAYGSLTVNPDGTYTFVPDAVAINALPVGPVTDVFSVTVDDGLGGTASTTLTININGANDTPEITAEVGTPTLVDTAANDTFANVTGQLDATDRDSGPTLSYGLASSEDGVGAYGSLTVNPDGTYTFVPDAVAINALPVGPVTDVFSVTVDDGLGGTASTTLTININGANDTPEITAEVGTPTLVDTAANDTFANVTGQLDATDRDSGPTLSYGLASSEDGVGAYGSLTVNPDGTYTFVPDAVAINALPVGPVTDVFSVTVDDGLGGTASTTLTININGANDTPEITAEVGTPTLVDTAANDTFANVTGQLDATDRDSGPTLSYGLASSEDGVGAYGSLTVNPDGTYTFVPDAVAINALPVGPVTDVFSVTVDDGLGGTASTTLTININGANDTPEITAEVGTPTLVDTAANDTFANVTGQLDATDRDSGPTLSYGLASSEDGVGAYGSLTVNPDGTYTFVPDAVAINALPVGPVTDVFSVTVDDGLGGTASTTLTININGANDTPEITAEVGTPTLVDTAANDTFANVTGQLDATDRDSGATLSYGLASSEDGVGAYGSLTVNPDGTYTFVPDAVAINALPVGAVTDVFSVTVDDGLGGTASTTLTINITGANDEPGKIIVGTDNCDDLTGGAGDDTISSRGGQDIVHGLGGHDVITGGADGDFLFGGDGNDTFRVTAGDLTHDVIDGGNDSDTLQFAGNVALSDGFSMVNVETLDMGGFRLNVNTATTIDLSSIQNLANRGQVVGNGSANHIIGTQGGDFINGGGGADILDGGQGNDVVNGGIGNDNLSGGAGSDTFVFNTALSAATNVDTIIDFNGADGDKIALDTTVFVGLGASVDPGDFGAVGDAGHLILYEASTGNLYYDANSDGVGVKFAEVADNTVLNNGNFTTTLPTP